MPKTDNVSRLLAGVKVITGSALDYLFPESSGVRVRCKILPNMHNCSQEKDCQGIDWTASEDGWVWWRAVDGLGITVGELATEDFIESWAEQWGPYESDPKAAFFQALYQAVKRIPGRVWPCQLT